MPAPPYSVGTSMPIRPFSPRTRMFSSGNSPVRACPACTVFRGRQLDAHRAALAQGPDVLERALAGAVVVFGAGSDLLAGDPARHVLDHQLLFIEPEFHARLAIVSRET